MKDTAENQIDDSFPTRPDGPYWEDAVYRYASRQRRSALEAGDDGEAVRLDELMQQFAGGSMADEVYWQLDAEARTDRRKRRQERKRQGRRPPDYAKADEAPSVNVADLKRRIYNPNVSRENVIKALEALPAAERKATIAGLPPGLRRKLGTYLKGR